MELEPRFTDTGVLIFNDQGHILVSNLCANQLFGYENDALLGMSVEQLTPKRFSIDYLWGLQNERNGSSIDESMKITGLRKDGGEHLLKISLKRFQGGNEPFTVAFIVDAPAAVMPESSIDKQTRSLVHSLANVETINRDLQLQIQHRKATEQKLIKIQRLYDTMVHNFPDGVIGVLDREMKYILIEGKELNEIDLPSLGLIGQSSTKHQDSVLAGEALTEIKKAFDGHSVSFEIKTGDRFYTISAVPLPDAQNNINEILCVLKNVTERKRLEDGLLKALEKEKELGELKSRFVTMASHEFKTPLTTILSSAFLLENYSGKGYDEEKIVHTSRIKRAVNNLTMILNEFLSLEKLEGNQVEVLNTNINIPKYMLELISEIEPDTQKGQMVSYEHSGQPTAYLDPNLLWSIMTNLVSNALKYSRQGEKIHVTSEIKNNQMTIGVRDYGIGIPANEHKNIFGRFYRARNVMNFEGTGLGLHIVEKNVRLLQGSISFTSQLDSGTEFTVILPNGGSRKESEIGQSLKI